MIVEPLTTINIISIDFMRKEFAIGSAHKTRESERVPTK